MLAASLRSWFGSPLGVQARRRGAISLLTVGLGGGLVSACADRLPVEPGRPPAGPGLLGTGGLTPANGRWIVLYKTGVRRAPSATLSRAIREAAPAAGSVPGASARLSDPGAVVEYSRVAVGFSGPLSDAHLRELRADPTVRAVLPDQPLYLQQDQNAASWGLDRLDQRTLPLSGTYRPVGTGTGAGVRVYIVDTGINFEHVEFGGRALSGFDWEGGNGGDCVGHGTHVAGTVGGATTGVAPGATLVSVRIFNCQSGGYFSSLLAGMDWIASDVAARGQTPAVVNMSIGGAGSAALNEAVDALVRANITVVVSAGNQHANACTQSPSGAAGAITVGASDRDDGWAGFSNTGSCVSLVAPGVGIRSAYIGSPTATAELSGTSMASPHAAGLAALVLQRWPGARPGQVRALLVNEATTGVLRDVPDGTANRLLWGGSLPQVLPDAPLLPPPTVTVPLYHAASNTCLGVPEDRGDYGTPMTLNACQGRSGQYFNMRPAGYAGPMATLGGAVCVDDWRAQGAVGDTVVTYGCHGGGNQQWTLNADGSVQGINGLCLEAVTTQDGPGIRLAVCTGAAAQRWSTVIPSPEVTVPVPRAGVAINLVTVRQRTRYCLDVADGRVTNGADASLTACLGETTPRTAQWQFVSDGQTVSGPSRRGQFTVNDGNATACLDLWGAQPVPGARVVVWECHGGENQRWTLRADGLIEGMGGMCLNVPSTGDAQGGTRLVVQPCPATGEGGGTRWTWQMALGGREDYPAPPRNTTLLWQTTIGDATLCLDVWGFDYSDGVTVRSWSCHKGTNQQWQLQDDGRADRVPTTSGREGRIVSGDKCLDIPGNAPTAGERVTLWTCHGGENQHWIVRSDGLIEGVGGMCLALEPGIENGRRLIQVPCGGTPNQKPSTWRWARL